MLAALCAALAVLCTTAALSPRHGRLAVADLARTSTLDARELSAAANSEMPVWQRLLQPSLRALSERAQGRWAGMSQDELRQAGINNVSVEDVVAIKVLAAIAGAGLMLCVALVLPSTLVVLPAVAFAGFVVPSVVIRRRRNSRRNQMLRELPDLVALLKAFVSSGTTLEQALHLISAQQAASGGNLLASEIRQALSEYGLGLGLEEALGLMAARTGLEELEMFAAALSQGKRQGAGMERILRDQEEVVRLAQRNRTTAEASRVGTRLVGVLVAVYLPEFMVLIMVPLFYGIFLRAFS